MSLLVLDEDAYAPRTEDQRYGLYLLMPGEERPTLISTCALDGIGTMLVTNDEDARVDDPEHGLGGRGAIGILDRVERRWIVKPWPRGGHL